MLDSFEQQPRHLFESETPPPSREYAVESPKNMSEAADLIKDENTKSEQLIDTSIDQLNAWTKKTGFDFPEQRAKLEEKRQELRLNQHLNFVELFNSMAIGTSVDRAYEKLSGTSKELYRLFVNTLPKTATDGTQEAVLEIMHAQQAFLDKPGELPKDKLPKDLKTFLTRYYKPFNEAAAKLIGQLHEEAKAEDAFRSSPDKLEGEALKSFLRNI